MKKNVSAAPTGAAQASYVRLEPGLPFVGSLLWPKAHYAALNKLLYWTVDTPSMEHTFPVGSVVGMRRVTRRRSLTLGKVYLFRYTLNKGLPSQHTVSVFGRLTQLGRGSMGLTLENPQGGSTTVSLWLSWKDEWFGLYETTHYVTIGDGTMPPVSIKKKCKLSTKRQSAEIQQQALFKGDGLMSLQFAGQPIRKSIVSRRLATLFVRLLLAESEENIAKLEAGLDEARSMLLLHEATSIIEKGGMAA